MKMNRAKIVSVLCLSWFLYGSLSLFAEGSFEGPEVSPRKESAGVVVRIGGLKGPSSVGMMGLISGTAKGVSIDFQVVPTPDVMTARVLSGEVDGAALPINLAANLYNKGVPYVLAAITGNGVIHLASVDGTVKSIADLKGKKVYNVNKGSTPDFLLRYLMSKAGLSEGDVTVDFSLSQTDLVQYFAAGKAEIAVIPEPFLTLAMKKNPRLQAGIDLQEEWGRVSGTGKSYPATAFFVKRSFLEEHPEAGKALLAAYADSIQWVQQNPLEAGRRAEQYLEIPQALVAEAMPRLGLAFVPASEAKADVRAFLSLLYDYAPQSIGGKLPDEAFFYTQP